MQVGQGIGAADDVGILEGAQHEHHGVDLADAAQEAVAEAFSRGRPGHEGGDVDELDGGRHHLARLAQLGQGLQAAVGHLGHADIGLRGRERVGGDGGVAPREGVEEGRLPGVGQPDDAQALHRRAI